MGAAAFGAATALITATAICGLIAWSGPVDKPRDRGSHSTPTPTAGGLGILAGASLGLLVFAALAPVALAGLGKIAAALGFAAALGIFGALDDLFDLDARLKFLVQIAFSLLFAIFVARIEAIPLTASLSAPLGPVIGVLGTSLWLLVAVNAVNFMDGANGLAPGSIAIGSTALAIAAFAGGDPALGAAALTAAMAGFGFLPWNFPKARVFQGDAGALFSSFFLAALAVIGAGPLGRGPVFLFFMPLVLLPFLTDVLLTLLARARAKKRLFDAHREHLYQRWLAQNGASHAALAGRTGVIMLIFSGAALLLRTAGPEAQASGFVAGTVAATVGWTLISRRNPNPKS